MDITWCLCYAVISTAGVFILKLNFKSRTSKTCQFKYIN